MSDYVKWLQSRLTAHGFACGPVDGISGNLTTSALKAFQTKCGLSATGIVDPATEISLRRSASIVSPIVASAIGADEKREPLSSFWPRQADVQTYFGKVGENQTTVEVPYDLKLAWDKATRIRRITVHKRVARDVLCAMQEVAGVYSGEERQALGLDIFGGSLNVRRMRGGTAYSMHSWGIAIDFDPERNGLTARAPQARLSHDDAKPFWQAWRDRGAIPLGQAIGRDWMHVQFARL